MIEDDSELKLNCYLLVDTLTYKRFNEDLVHYCVGVWFWPCAYEGKSRFLGTEKLRSASSQAHFPAGIFVSRFFVHKMCVMKFCLEISTKRDIGT